MGTLTRSPKITRSPSDEPMLTSLPAHVTDRDYRFYYCVMSYAEFMHLLAIRDADALTNQAA